MSDDKLTQLHEELKNQKQELNALKFRVEQLEQLNEIAEDFWKEIESSDG